MSSGIVLLEKQLLSNTDSESAHSTKRARLTTAVATETTNAWVELARLTIMDDVMLPCNDVMLCVQDVQESG